MNCLRLAMIAFTLIHLTACHSQQGAPVKNVDHPLSIDRLYDSPKLSGQFPRSLKISPDGKRITFLKGKKDNFKVLDLWQFDIKTGKQSLLVDSSVVMGGAKEKISDEEQARRERKRINATGIVEYQWSKSGDKILFPIGGDIYIYNMNKENPVQRVTKSKAFEIDPRFSPLGNYISFVRDHNVYVVDLKTMKEIPVTTQGTAEMPMGIAEFVAQEEMGRYRGYWWSPGEKFLAVAQVNNGPVENIKRFEVYSDKVSVIEQKYPKVGAKNAIVKLGVFALNKSKPLWIPIKAKDYYVPNVRWLPGKEDPALSYTIQSRNQKKVEFWTYKVASKKNQKIFEESDDAWVNIRHDFLFFSQGKKLLWVSEKSGFAHLYVYNMETGKGRPLTSGSWEVTSLHSVDEVSGSVFFSGTKESPLINSLYRTSLNNEADPVRVGDFTGSQNIIMGKKSKFYLSYQSTPEKPPSLGAYDLTGKRLFFVEENALDKNHPLSKYSRDLGQWEFGHIQTKDGVKLYYKILKPKNFDPKVKYPVIQYVYGGPGVQLVTKSWSGRNLYHQFLAQRGFIVVIADNRGTTHRGRDFERSYYLKFGQQEVEDQSLVMSKLLEKNSYMNSDQVGVYGHSYGGYLTLMLLMQRPNIYKVGVSGAPVVDWTFYDTHYTERYMGKPQDNPELYKKSNVLSYVGDYKGRLLVVHGMADDNVLYSHSLILYQKMQEEGKLFDIMAYPGAKHGIRRKKSWSIHYAKTIVDYFEKNLKGAK